jgi:DNA repair exonuclease SbcCD ATPase subunit
LATSFEPPIRRLAVEAFRGFRDRQEFNLAASAVVVAGPNGTGKTSFFDALQWCLLGSIERLEGLRGRRNVEHIVNQYRLNDRAVVEVDLLIDGRSFALRRTGDRRGTTLEISEQATDPVFGDDAEALLSSALVPGQELSLELALTTSGLMQQDVMRAVLEAKPADRYRHISTVLGLSALEDFEDAVKELAAEARRRADTAKDERDAMAGSLSEARGRLAQAEQRLQTLPQLEALRTDTLAALRDTPEFIRVDTSVALTSPEDVRNVSASIGKVIDRLQSFIAAWADAEGSARGLDIEPSDEEVRAAGDAEEAARVELASLQADEVSARSNLGFAQAAAEDIARLAALAIPLLTDHCPVCGQSIDPAHVEQELRAQSAASDTMVALQNDVRNAREAVRRGEAALTQLATRLRDLRHTKQRWDAYRDNEAAAVSHFSILVTTDADIGISALNAEALAPVAPQLLDYLRSARRRLLELLNTLEQGLDRGAVERAQSEVASYGTAVDFRTARLEEESQRAQQLKTLADGTVQARVEVTEQRFKAVQPLVADVFSRLDPHPAFKTIEFELDTYYRRGTTSPMVRDLVENVSADPLLVFSTSQANIAALSYFLAMGWSAGNRGLPFVLLDDPVQSMDDVNVLGFADLSRHLRRGRQLIISTHERRLAKLLERKLAPRSAGDSTVVFDFVGWDRSGPTVERREVASQLLEDPIRVVQAAS